LGSAEGAPLQGPAGAQPSPRWVEALSHPAFQAYLRFLTDPETLESARRLIVHPNRLNLIYAEIAWVVLLLIFRAWRLGKSARFLGRMWIRTYTMILGFVVGSLVLPYALLGQDFWTLAKKGGTASIEVASALLQGPP
jgi:hypothetical protein